MTNETESEETHGAVRLVTKTTFTGKVTGATVFIPLWYVNGSRYNDLCETMALLRQSQHTHGIVLHTEKIKGDSLILKVIPDSTHHCTYMTFDVTLTDPTAAYADLLASSRAYFISLQERFCKNSDAGSDPLACEIRHKILRHNSYLSSISLWRMEWVARIETALGPMLKLNRRGVTEEKVLSIQDITRDIESSISNHMKSAYLQEKPKEVTLLLPAQPIETDAEGNPNYLGREHRERVESVLEEENALEVAEPADIDRSMRLFDSAIEDGIPNGFQEPTVFVPVDEAPVPALDFGQVRGCFYDGPHCLSDVRSEEEKDADFERFVKFHAGDEE